MTKAGNTVGMGLHEDRLAPIDETAALKHYTHQTGKTLTQGCIVLRDGSVPTEREFFLLAVRIGATLAAQPAAPSSGAEAKFRGLLRRVLDECKVDDRGTGLVAEAYAALAGRDWSTTKATYGQETPGDDAARPAVDPYPHATAALVDQQEKAGRPFKDGDLVRITNREQYHKGRITAETRYRRDDGSIVWHFYGDTLSCTLKEGEFVHV